MEVPTTSAEVPESFDSATEGNECVNQGTEIGSYNWVCRTSVLQYITIE